MHRALLVVIAAAACHGGATDAGPPCGVVAAKFLALAKMDLGAEKVDATTARAVEDQLPAMRDSLAQHCTETAWAPAVRQCMAAAADHVAFEACEQQLTEDQRRDLARGADGKTESR